MNATATSDFTIECLQQGADKGRFLQIFSTILNFPKTWQIL